MSPLNNDAGETVRDRSAAATALVSVIIPCYNQAIFLEDAVESVLAQTHEQVEIIVVDDGSPDNTADVVRRYRGVRYIRQANQGLSGARNTGLRASHGHYLVFLDADDCLLPDALRAGLDCFASHPRSVMVSGHHRYIKGDGSLLNEYPPERIDDDPYLALLERNYIGMHATVMYRHEIFDRVGGFDTSLKSCEDYDLYLRIARRFPVSGHSRLVAEYRWHGANMTRNSGRMLQSALRVLRSQWPYVQANQCYLAACRRGVRFWRGYFGRLLFRRLRNVLTVRAWRQVVEDLAQLARFCPAWASALFLDAILSVALRHARAAGGQKSPQAEPRSADQAFSRTHAP